MKLSGMIAAAVVIAMSGVSLADVTYTGQTRSVTAKLTGSIAPGTFMETFAASDFGLFDVIANIEWDPEHECEAIASQRSELLPDGMVARGLMRASDGRQNYGGWAESNFDVTFEVSEPTAYHLVGAWAGRSAWPLDELGVRLEGPGGVLYESHYRWTIDETETFDVVGLLPAGSYRLYARAFGRHQLTMSTGSFVAGDYDVGLSFSDCLADLNGDAIVDFSDYLEFLNLFEEQAQRVDFTLDGIVDFADYLEFLNLFDAGCD